jgi:hypothetical protein
MSLATEYTEGTETHGVTIRRCHREEHSDER